MTLLVCKQCRQRFRGISTLSKHRLSRHPQSVSSSIRAGQRSSTHMPSKRAERLGQCVQEIAGFVATVTPAIVSRDPSFAPAVLASIARSIEACREFVPTFST